MQCIEYCMQCFSPTIERENEIRSRDLAIKASRWTERIKKEREIPQGQGIPSK